MAVTTDIGESNDIHPKNKQDVGLRLAAIALNNIYGKPMEYCGPVYESMLVQGNKVILNFTHTGSGLMVKDKYGYIRGFEIAGSDHHFHYAKAFLENNKVVVYADEVTSSLCPSVMPGLMMPEMPIYITWKISRQFHSAPINGKGLRRARCMRSGNPDTSMEVWKYGSVVV